MRRSAGSQLALTRDLGQNKGISLPGWKVYVFGLTFGRCFHAHPGMTPDSLCGTDSGLTLGGLNAQQVVRRQSGFYRF